MNKKFFFTFNLLIIILCLPMTACPGFFDRGLNVDEEDQCYALVYEIGTTGDNDAEFNLPSAIDVDTNSNVYIVDTDNNRIQKFDAKGTFIKEFGSSELLYPGGIAVTDAGDVYVADKGNHRIVRYSTDGAFQGVISNSDGEAGSGTGEFDRPESIDVSADGQYVCVADPNNNRIQIYNGSSWTEITGYYISGNTNSSGQPIFTSLSKVGDIALDGKTNPNIYIAEKGYNRVIMLQYNTDYDENALLLNTYVTKNISAGETVWYYFPAVAGKSYSVNWNDASQGNGSYTEADVVVSAYREDQATAYFTDVDDGYSNTQTISAVATENTYLKITNQGSTGDFSIKVYSSGVENTTDTQQYFLGEKYDNDDFIIGKDTVGSAGTETSTFNYPRGIAYYGESESVFIVADTINNRIQEFRYDGQFIEAWEKDGLITNSPGHDEIIYPFGIAIDKERSVYVVESTENRFKKFQYRCVE